jgi:hypothetical protein
LSFVYSLVPRNHRENTAEIHSQAPDGASTCSSFGACHSSLIIRRLSAHSSLKITERILKKPACRLLTTASARSSLLARYSSLATHPGLPFARRPVFPPVYSLPGAQLALSRYNHHLIHRHRVGYWLTYKIE